MKPIVNKTSLFVLMFLFSTVTFVNAQDDARIKEQQKIEAEKLAASTNELVLGLPKISDKTLFIISETSLKIKGLTFVSFCEGHKLALFRYSKETFAKPEDVIKAFEKENIIMPMFVKEGNFKDVEEMCSTK